ncbi:hypothetical protein MAPG_03504 [Magnaporthiopsis poae ATCC 64411]|uniref:Uncharacterized protein n=1 Tax=Magnaporthiopsis poae (strain ATCC 64411 / 73-15) TaxID=644358 RepID=A0A0C4DU69_MAGP6|nr:hypothetical protein MAPG_03504 [Magnaporthiopsis poae ATCC 64411]
MRRACGQPNTPIIDPSPSSLRRRLLFLFSPLFFFYSFRDPFTGRWSRNRDSGDGESAADSKPCLASRVGSPLPLASSRAGQGGHSSVFTCLGQGSTRTLSCLARAGPDRTTERSSSCPRSQGGSRSARATVLWRATSVRPRRWLTPSSPCKLQLERAQGTMLVPCAAGFLGCCTRILFSQKPCLLGPLPHLNNTWGPPTSPARHRTRAGGRRLGRRLCDQAADCQLDSKEDRPCVARQAGL